jgi:tRNA threonylcarbamoyladenosine modification (KEOPS) complex Cgi121 subunit
MDESPSEMMLESAGRYLIEDWQGIEMGEKGEEQIVPFTKDNGAIALANSFELWSFVLENARRIQLEADAEKEEVLGKSEPQQTGVEKNTRRSRTQSTKH